jgi:uncharacterized SAM-binding protein YcdF (DUF218 family)
MFFVLSKIFWMFVQPLNALCFLGLTGFALRFWKKECGNRLIGVAMALVLFFGFIPVGPVMMGWLEYQYEKPEKLPSNINGIIVLGGMFDGHLSRETNEISANDNIERMICFVELAKKYPHARKVFSGGSGDISHPDASESDVARDYFRTIGMDEKSVFYDMDSRNTYENAEFSKELINPTEKQNWVLITSAFHMPRSVGIFEKVGWDVIPYPCDYKTTGEVSGFFGKPLDAVHNYRMLNIAVKEVIGSIVYYVTGKTAFILPD